MAQCAYCKTETQLYENEVPVCTTCADLPREKLHVKARLYRELHNALLRADRATESFTAVTSNRAGGTPLSDGVQRIHNASHELAIARDAMMKAHNRLNEFLNTGTLPKEEN
jgi:hypothetical protein